MSLKFESSVDNDMVIKLLSESKYLINDNYINAINKDDYIKHESNSYINDGSRLVKYIFSDRKLIGAYVLERLDWDSEIFGRNMWKMKLIFNESIEESLHDLRMFFIEDCRKYSIEHISCQINTRDYNSTCFLENIGFKITDSIIRFGTKLDSCNIKELSSNLASQITTRKYENKDYDKYLNLVKQVFHNYSNRFMNDGTFTSEQCKRLYTQWATNSVKGFADLVIVAENNNDILGFSTVKYKRPYHNNLIIAEGQLAGVSSMARGQGVNTMMMLKRLNITSSYADYYEVGTQVYNYASQRSFYRCGLRPFDSYFSFHISFN